MTAALPLYEQLQRKPYPAHQKMDKASLQWLHEQLDPTSIDINSLIKDYRPYPGLDYKTISNFISPVNICGIHGFGHSRRVSVYCWLVIQHLKLDSRLSNEKIKEVVMAALFHDIGRVNDNTDADHGKRSAKWINENFAGDFSTEIISAVENHSIDRPESASLALAILQSADALDRYRLPKVSWWPDYSRVPLEVSELDALCRFITYSTEKIMLDCPDSEAAEREMRLWLQQQGI